MKSLLKASAVLAAVCLVGCAQQETRPFVTLHGPASSVKVFVEIAADDASRERGLMDRTDLPPNTGMLFIMDHPDILTFWMKNTLIPLDIIFFDATQREVSTAEMIPCKADPCPLTYSAPNALYALEVPTQFVRTHGISSGWTLALPAGQK